MVAFLQLSLLHCLLFLHHGTTATKTTPTAATSSPPTALASPPTASPTASPTTLLHPTLTPPTTSTTHSTHVCVSSFSTNQELAHFPWSSTTDLIQSIAPLTLDHAGTITPSPDWPLASLTTWAHGNATRLWVGIKTASKSEAAQFLASSPALLTQTAIRLVNMVSDNNYDGLQLDFEGLKMASKTGYETFVAACHTHCAVLTAKNPNKPMLFMTTLYVDILLRPVSAPSAYDARYLSSFGNGLFIMGYDMTWLHTKPGTGWARAGPNAPLNGKCKGPVQGCCGCYVLLLLRRTTTAATAAAAAAAATTIDTYNCTFNH